MLTQIRLLLISGVAAALLAGCNKPESPAEVQQDMGEAQREGAADVAEARSDAQESTQDIAMAQAEAAHKVETERCEGLPGDAQKACKEAADATLEMAKTTARGATAPAQ